MNELGQRRGVLTEDTHIPQLFKKSRKQAMGARKMYHFSAEVECLRKQTKKKKAKEWEQQKVKRKDKIKKEGKKRVDYIVNSRAGCTWIGINVDLDSSISYSPHIPGAEQNTHPHTWIHWILTPALGGDAILFTLQIIKSDLWEMETRLIS